MERLYIGVVGYTKQDFNETIAENYLQNAFDAISSESPGTLVLVSGLTRFGVPKIAYEEASSRGWKTVGVACAKAENYEQFPVNGEIIVGDNWGDESNAFLSLIDVLVHIGGGEQSKSETDAAKQREIPVYESDL